MRVEVKIDNSCIEPKIIVLTASMTEEVSKIIQKLSDNNPQIITGSKNEKIEVLEQDELIRIYAANSRVFAAANSGEYLLRLRLYEAEERLFRLYFKDKDPEFVQELFRFSSVMHRYFTTGEFEETGSET